MTRRQVTCGRPNAGAIALLAALAASAHPAQARDLTLDQALEMATRHSDRARVIEGDLRVAERRYSAQHIGFLVPEISINAQLPTYQEDESYRLYGGLDQKTTVKTTDLNLRSNIQLKQHLITGGEVTARANLWQNKSDYPRWQDLNDVINQRSRQGIYELEVTQPLLKPSEAKNTLADLGDDLEIAKLTRRKETAAMRVEVAEAYFGLLKADAQMRTARDRLQAATLQAQVDSMKLADRILSEEDWLKSVSDRLEAQLGVFDVQNERSERSRDLAEILDLGPDEELSVSAPQPPDPLAEEKKRQLLARWDQSTDILAAELEYGKVKRAAHYEAASHGISGDLTAGYTLGRGTVTTTGETDDEIKTNSWQLSVNLTYPLWDGGASKAAVQAARIREERSRLELESAQRSARAEIVDIFNRLEVSGQKLDLLRKQVGFAEDRLEIARQRRENGEISDIEFLDRRIERSEAEETYLEELRSYTSIRLDLEARWDPESLS
jgi:outer membrane protein TolC